MNNKVLIIGGNGYVGSRLCENLEYDIMSVDLNLFITNNSLKNIQTDFNKLDKDFINKFNTIILLAGHSSVRMCDEYPTSVFNNNVRNFVSLLEKISENQTLIYASSGSVYGDCKFPIADENISLDAPHNMYDLTKQMIDTYYLTSAKKGRIFGLRLGTINGYSPTLRNDVMMNSMCSSAWQKNEILLFNPNTKRSIIGTTDLLRAIQTIIASNNANGGIYNLSSFTKTSGEMAKIVSNATNSPINLVNPEEYNKEKINEKLISSKYNYELSSKKFSIDFNFTFNETPESIITDLIENKNKMIFTNRNSVYNYSG